MHGAALTLASHSIPATEMPSSSTTVIHPIILMSFNGSTMITEWSCVQTRGKYEYKTRNTVITTKSWHSAPSSDPLRFLRIPPRTWLQPLHWQRQKSDRWTRRTLVPNCGISSNKLHLRKNKQTKARAAVDYYYYYYHHHHFMFW